MEWHKLRFTRDYYTVWIDRTTMDMYPLWFHGETSLTFKAQAFTQLLIATLKATLVREKRRVTTKQERNISWCLRNIKPKLIPNSSIMTKKPDSCEVDDYSELTILATRNKFRQNLQRQNRNQYRIS
ncbi:hypothetical protein N665_0218s0106 [Sinapis alba]|nr:hypothetical protein N665_0218s0106 [Sinapis alba]